MVKTRLRARLEAARLSLAGDHDTKDSSLAPHSHVSSSRSPGSSQNTEEKESQATEHTPLPQPPPPSVEELALRAAVRMKEQLLGSGIESAEGEGEEEGMSEREGEREVGDLRLDGGSDDEGVSEKTPNILFLEDPSSGSNTIPKKKPMTSTHELASSLQPDLKEELYFSYDRDTILTRPHASLLDEGDLDQDLMRRSVITPDFEKRDRAPPIYQSRYALQKLRKAERERSTGSQWFDMPATPLTPELKNDLRIVKMRNALDPTHHYRANDSKQLPRYFQVGRVVSGPAEYYSSRIPQRQRKRTIVEELLADERFRTFQRKKYGELQTKSMSGRKRLKQIKYKRKFKK